MVQLAVVSVIGQPDAAAVVEYAGARVQKPQKPEKEGVAAGSDRVDAVRPDRGRCLIVPAAKPALGNPRKGLRIARINPA